MSEENKEVNEMQMDVANLYEKKTYVDMAHGAIDAYTPVDYDGNLDATRETIYVSIAQAMSERGLVPITAPMEGVTTLKDAVAGFGDAIDAQMNWMIEQAKEMARQERSRIITPEEVVGKPALSIVK